MLQPRLLGTDTAGMAAIEDDQQPPGGRGPQVGVERLGRDGIGIDGADRDVIRDQIVAPLVHRAVAGIVEYGRGVGVGRGPVAQPFQRGQNTGLGRRRARQEAHVARRVGAPFRVNQYVAHRRHVVGHRR